MEIIAEGDTATGIKPGAEATVRGLTPDAIGADHEPAGRAGRGGRCEGESGGKRHGGSDGVAQGGSTLHGNAVFAENGVAAWDGTTGLLLSDNLFTSASAIGVLLDDSSAGMDRNEWSGNAVGLRQQACNGPDHVAGPNDDGLVDDVAPLTEADTLGAPSAQVCPASNVLIAYDLAFTTLFLPEIETEE